MIEHALNVATVKLCQLNVADDRKHVSAESLRQSLARLDGAGVLGDVVLDQHGDRHIGVIAACHGAGVIAGLDLAMSLDGERAGRG